LVISACSNFADHYYKDEIAVKTKGDKRGMMIRCRSISSHLFDILNYAFLFLLAVACLLPMVHILAVSLSDRFATGGQFVTFYPMLVDAEGHKNFGITFESYRKVISAGVFWNSFRISVMRTLLGTGLTLLLTVLTAYPLSKTASVFRGRSVFIWFIVFTMMFSGGLIPLFLVIRSLGLQYNFLSLILPFAFSSFYTIMLINFFRDIPSELEDAAMIDGASHWQLLFKIYIPLSMPALATLGLFSAVANWNEWFFGMIFMRAADYPLQTFLRTVVIQMNAAQVARDTSNYLMYSDRSLRAATIFVTTAPILVVYPFVQRFFITGIKLGAVKG
jgi:putative aldouronate transport system permease protein